MYAHTCVKTCISINCENWSGPSNGLDPNCHLETMFFHFKIPLFLFCLFANSESYLKIYQIHLILPVFLWGVADSIKIF